MPEEIPQSVFSFCRTYINGWLALDMESQARIGHELLACAGQLDLPFSEAGRSPGEPAERVYEAPTASISDERVAEIRNEREGRYGSPHVNQITVGMVWHGILSNHYQTTDLPPIPGHIVALMMAGLKLNRAAFPSAFATQDSYDDGIGYLQIANLVDKRPRQ